MVRPQFLMPEPLQDAGVVDRYGFTLGKTALPARSEAEQLASARKENSRALKWQGMISDWTTFSGGAGQKKLKRRVRKGIPDGVRGHIWQVASGSMDAHQARPLLYGQLRGRPSPMDSHIDKDLHRTMPTHVQFRADADGQQQLFNVCHALAVHAPEVGYNQAEAYVVATLLTYMTEEEAFWMLEHISRYCGQGRMWMESFEGWVETRERLDAIVRVKLPKLHAHLKHNGVIPDLYALQWFLTLFAKDFPFEATLGIWDVFLCEPQPKASKILYRVVLVVLQEGEKELLRMSDVQELTDHIRKLPSTCPALQGGRLVERALAIPLKTRTLFPDSAR